MYFFFHFNMNEMLKDVYMGKYSKKSKFSILHPQPYEKKIYTTFTVKRS